MARAGTPDVDLVLVGLDPAPVALEPPCAGIVGVSMHAAVRAEASDRPRS